MIAERLELNDFIFTWQGKPVGQVVEELASYSQETKKVPDYYLFQQDLDGDLYSPCANSKVSKIIERSNLIWELEGQAFDKINSWFKQNTDGAAIWIAPPDPIYYPNPRLSKIIISEIGNQGNKKILINRAIMLDIDASESLKLAKDLSEYAQNRPLLSSLNEVRSTPLIFNNLWRNILEEHLDLPKIWEMIRTGADIKAKEEALAQARSIYPSLMIGDLKSVEGNLNGFFGAYDSTCPVAMGGASALRLFLDHSVVLENCPKIKCRKPNCAWEANSIELQKIKNKELTCCPKCGWKPNNS